MLYLGPSIVMKEVTFNENGKPIGPNAAAYSSCLGKATRTHCSPTYEFWWDIDPRSKTDLWRALVVSTLISICSFDLKYISHK